MKSKHLILLLLIPLSEIKAIFYDYYEKVSWYLFSDNKKYIDNVLEDYSNIIIIGVVLYFPLFVKLDIVTKQILFFLFIINAWDFVFLGLYDNDHYLWKIPLTVITYMYANSKVSFQRV